MALLVFALPLGCGARASGASPGASASSTSRSEPPWVILGPRAEVVAAADSLAVAGTRANGEQGLALTVQAAELRRRLWRLEGREADALEALELFRGLDVKKGEAACLARLERALLEGELRANPAETYRNVYRAHVGATEPGCRDKADRALATLAAFRPLPNVLTEIERQVGGAGDGGVGDAGSQPVNARVDENGPVIVPTMAGGKPKGPVRISSIARYGAKDAARVVVFVTDPTVFDVGFIAKESGDRGPRLYVDIDSASYKGKLEYPVGGLVERVRVGKRGKGTRVVLDLNAPAYRKVFYLPEPFRLVIDVSKEAPTGGSAPSLDGPRPVKRVVLDPGHGGHDPGAIGPSGLREKDVTLDVAHRAAPLLARELGISTLLTRDSDDFIPLDERAARANAFQADLFISVHCNASEDPAARGFMTFVLDDSRDTTAFSVAARENAASPAAAAELANVMSHVLDASSVQRSVRLADLLQRSAGASFASAYADEVDGGVKRAGFYVLAGARMPAVLFETSFISNPSGETRLNTGDYRQKLADAIVNAVRAYREGK